MFHDQALKDTFGPLSDRSQSKFEELAHTVQWV